MIMLTKLNDQKFVLNCEWIETVYENPDTTIHMMNGKMYIVKETMQEVAEKTKQYKREQFYCRDITAAPKEID